MSKPYTNEIKKTLLENKTHKLVKVAFTDSYHVYYGLYIKQIDIDGNNYWMSSPEKLSEEFGNLIEGNNK